MSVKSYRENDKTFYKVYVNVRCKSDVTLRAQKKMAGIESLAAARRIEKQFIAELSGKLSLKNNEGLHWKRILELWKLEAEAGNLKRYQASTISDTFSILMKWTKPWFNKPAQDLNSADGKDVHKLMINENLSIKAQCKVKSMINTVFKFAIDERLIKHAIPNPMSSILIRLKDEKVPDILTLSEIRKFLDAAKEVKSPWYPIWATALLSGMRNGELFALEWDDIDFESDLICVSKSFEFKMNKVKCTKAGYWRNVPISSELKALFYTLKAEIPNRPEADRKYVLPRLWKWDKGLQAKELKFFLKSIGITPIKFHALRACFATQLLTKGVNQTVVMKICGWQDLKTMGIYIRMAGIDESGATECLSLLPREHESLSNVVNLF